MKDQDLPEAPMIPKIKLRRVSPSDASEVGVVTKLHNNCEENNFFDKHKHELDSEKPGKKISVCDVVLIESTVD